MSVNLPSLVQIVACRLSPSQRQAIIWTNAGILLIQPLGKKISEISIEIHIFSIKKMHLKMSSAKCQPFCLLSAALSSLKEQDMMYGMISVNWSPSPVGADANCRANSRLVPSQWETSLQSNAVSHWLGANLKSSLNWLPGDMQSHQTCPTASSLVGLPGGWLMFTLSLMNILLDTLRLGQNAHSFIGLLNKSWPI